MTTAPAEAVRRTTPGAIGGRSRSTGGRSRSTGGRPRSTGRRSRSAARRFEPLALVAVVVASVVVYARFAGRVHLGYDEAWHVFVATVQPLSQLVDELKMEAHPPLHYLVLRLVTPLGGAELWPRLASIGPAAATVVLTFLCGRALRVGRAVALVAALAAGLAPSHVNIAICVRAYSLATAFTMLALWCAIPAAREPLAAPRRAWTGFATASVLAMASEYSAIIAVAAMAIVLTTRWLLAAGGLLATRGPLGAAPAGALRSSLRACAPGLVALAAAVILLLLYRRWADIGAYNHLQEFLPGRQEGVVAFATRGAASTLTALLWPLRIPQGWPAFAVVGLGTAACLGGVLRSARHGDAARAAVLAMHLVLWALLLLLAQAGLYPYGGKLRQQFVLFPFLVASAALALDAIRRRLRTKRERTALVALAAAAVLAAAWRGFGVPLEEFNIGPFWRAEMTAARAMLRPDDAIFTRQYNQIGLYTNTRDWRWRLRAHLGPQLDRFTLRRGDERLTVIRDRVWTVPIPPPPELLTTLAELVRREALGGLVVLAIPQGAFDATAAAQDATRADLDARAAAAGLVVTDHAVSGHGMVFRVAPRDAQSISTR